MLMFSTLKATAWDCMPRADNTISTRNAAAAALRDLPNLGPKSAAMLARAGITTLHELKKRGAVAAYVAVKQTDGNASLNLLYALVGVLEGLHWREIQRTRKLELVMAVDDYECRHPLPSKQSTHTDELLQLRNIGKAMRHDFELLGIRTCKQLAKCDADELYARIQTLTGTRHDPCVWDTYAAAIHQAKTGEARAWWEFTKMRKARQSRGEFQPGRYASR
jgi:predicted flap endonuclease-1-like 5' DNA nuclease